VIFVAVVTIMPRMRAFLVFAQDSWCRQHHIDAVHAITGEGEAGHPTSISSRRTRHAGVLAIFMEAARESTRRVGLFAVGGLWAWVGNRVVPGEGKLGGAEAEITGPGCNRREAIASGRNAGQPRAVVSGRAVAVSEHKGKAGGRRTAQPSAPGRPDRESDWCRKETGPRQRAAADS